MNFCPKGKEANPCQLHWLKGKGEADDADGKEQGREKMHEGQFPAKEEDPDDIEEETSDIGARFYSFTKGKETKIPNFKALQTKGNADHCDTKQKPNKGPTKPGPEPAEQKPDDISKCFHSDSS